MKTEELLLFGGLALLIMGPSFTRAAGSRIGESAGGAASGIITGAGSGFMDSILSYARSVNPGFETNPFNPAFYGITGRIFPWF